jgi:asparagine synthase (glutamine-hydrolysing)
MCGLTGWLGAESRGYDALINSASASLTAIAHRGPDDQGIWVDSSCRLILAHARLSILDPSPLGHQPMVADDGSAVLVYNGEIYNYQELRAELERDGARFRGHSDTEVILRLYERLRPSSDEALGMFLRRLKGIFALAIWDCRSEELVLARDGLGVKPLYVSEADGSFCFASEPKALLHLVPGTPAIDLPAIDQYLCFLWTPGSRTLWKGVHKLQPGSCLRVGPGRDPRTFRWYRLPVAGTAPSRGGSASDLAKATASHLRDAVHRQMVSDAPIGAFLSGGIDSTSVVYFAREVDPKIQCFTIAVDGPGDSGFVDDLPYARQAAKELNVDLHAVEVKASQFAEDLEEMVWHLDEPVADPAALNVLYISRLARSHGIKVLLSGVGGDDVFSGYRRHTAVMDHRYWSWLPARARAVAGSLASAAVDRRGATGRRIGKLMSSIHLDGDELLVNYFRWARSDVLRSLYSPALRDAIGRRRPEQPMLDYLQDLPTLDYELDRLLALEQRFFLGDHNLPYTDKMSMAAGVEVRVPFLDQDLLEFAAQIPAPLKQRGNYGKWILRKAMEPYLPREVAYRPKSGFGAPVDRWIRNDLRDWVRELLSDGNLRHRGLFEPKAVSKLMSDNEAGRISAAYTILSLVCIELWCRRFIDPMGGQITKRK